MNARYVAIAIPFFFVLIAIELAINVRRGDARYRFEDSIASLSCGVGQQVIGLFLKGITLAGYVFLYEHARFFTMSPRSVVAWLVLLFGVDLGYYAFHRASHRVNAIWATHVVHHQSEEYNLSTALRQSWFGKLFEWVFYLPLAVVGFSPEMFLAMTTLNTLYQFWIHTRSIGKLGPIEWVFNTPSHHRVHHGIDPAYIDKNYAGIFIVWDRMFGTFIEEKNEPTYGIVKPLSSWNPLWANLHRWAEILEMARRTRKFWDKLYAFVAPPEWRPADLGGPATVPEVDHASYRKFDVRAPRGIVAYVSVQFAIVAAIVSGMLWFERELPHAVMAALAAMVVATLIAWSGLFERKAWGAPLEIARVVAAMAIGAWGFGKNGAIVAAAVGVTSLAWLLLALRRAPDVVAV